MILLQILLILVNFLRLIACDLSQELTLLEKTLWYEDHIIPIAPKNISLLSGKRDFFTLFIITSTDPSHGCTLCQTLDEVSKIVSKHWFKDNLHSGKLYIVKADLKDESNMELLHILETNTVPHVWLIPPSEINSGEDLEMDQFALLRQPRYIFQMPVASQNDQVLLLARFLSENVHVDFSMKEKKGSEQFLLSFSLTLGTILLIKKRGPKFVTNASKRSVYQYLILFILMVILGGYQFCAIRGVPFVARNDKNNIIVISGGTLYQFGFEIILVGITYTLLASLTLLLIYIGSRKNIPIFGFSSQMRPFIVILVCIIIYMVYSCLTSIVIRKDASYPYYFTKLF